ncbi:uncharacterized protein LOC134574588 isoform X2 [Pelobates fuscus]|uniref:uncharacterized protein LOC134574588 isoform X2 n=1 Tax=Pelobates fuscus TaxID=191477 RepID=UPI002FE4B5B1
MKNKELSKQDRDLVVEKYQSGLGYKKISRTVNIPRSTVHSIIKKWKVYGTTENLRREGRPPKIGNRDQNMPKCIVKDCPHKTGRKPERPTVVFHAFPNNLDKIKQWLLQTRQDFGDLETFAIEVLEGKKSEKHCLCSEHFTSDCYIYQGSKVLLSRDAIPTIFPGGEKSGTTEECEVGPPRKRYRSGTPEECSIFIDALGIPSHTRHEDASTQTDPHFGHKDVGTKTSATLGKKHASTQTKGI